MRATARTIWVSAALCIFVDHAVAQCVEVATGICVSRRSYGAPVNEQPFFGFIEKTPAIRNADEKLVAQVLASGSTKESAAKVALNRGWTAFEAGDFVTAGRRFNQAYLLDQRSSGVYQGFAAISATRFNDYAYAEELFRVAKRLPDQAPTLNADYGRLLMILKRPSEALPLLEQAVKDASSFPTAWSNLGFARLQTGDRRGACAAAAEAARLNPSQIVRRDLATLRSQAECPRSGSGAWD